MGQNTLVYSLIFCVVLLFGGLSALLVLDNFNTRTYTINQQATGSDVVLESNVPEVGILVQTTEEDMDAVAEKLKSKGARVNKHKAGHVISAVVPRDSLSELSNEGIAPLPNRQVQAFSVDVSEINAQSFIEQGITGNNVKVAIIDSGVSNANVIAAKDFTGSGNTDDEFNHGNKIAEVILSVAPNAQIINAKVLDKNGLGSEAGIVAGINYAIEQNADVISISSGGLFDDLSSPMVVAVEDAVAQGIVVVIAAGNCGECGSCGEFKGVATPGNSPSAITVGAVDMCISPGKNYGNYIKPDVVANGNVLGMTGTSISTPFVSGAIALILEKYDANPAQVKSLIEQNAVDMGEKGKDVVYGSGKLNLELTDVEIPVVEEEIELPETIESDRKVFAFGNPTTKLGDWSEFVFSGPAFFESELLNSGTGFIYSFDGSGEVNNVQNYGITQYNYLGMHVYDVEAINSNDAYAAGSGKIKRYSGSSWSDEALPAVSGFDFYSIDSNANGMLFAGGYNATKSGIMLKKSGSWSQEAFVFGPIDYVAFVNNTVALAVSSSNDSGTMTISYYVWRDGVWSSQGVFASNSRGKINAITAVSDNLAYAVGNKGTIMVWNGNSWSDDASPVTDDLWDVDFYDATNGYAVGSNTTILQHTGSAWSIYSKGEPLINLRLTNPDSSHPVMVNTTFYEVDAFSSNSGYLYGEGYALLNGGTRYYSRINFKLEPTAPYLNVPVLYVPENSVVTFNLSLYSDATSFSVATADLSKCTVSGSTLTVDLGTFTGVESCEITATRNSMNAMQDVAIEAVPAYPLADLAVSQVLFTGDNSLQITVDNLGRAVANNIDMKIIDVDSGTEYNYVISNIANRSSFSSTETVSFSISRGSKVVVIADHTNSIREESESNNRYEKKYMKKDVYLDVNVQAQFITPIKNYLTAELKEYNVVPTQTVDTDVVHVNYNSGNSNLGCDKGTVYANGNSETKPYSGLVYSALTSGRTSVYVCGARIEGIVAALRAMDKDELGNNKVIFLGRDDKSAIATFDFMKTETPITASLVERALYGGLASTDKVVRASDGTWLRLRNYKPIVSKSFMDYLFAIDPSKPWLEPVIMAGGLWSDITAWEEAGKEIAAGVEDGYLRDTIDYAPRDVWLIELTGGPGTDCDSCDDYTYNDVVDIYWPAAVGGVLKLTNRGQAAYVGHSNGGRAALDSLASNPTGVVNAGTLLDGTSYDLPSDSIDTFIGVGVPGAFVDSSPFSECMKKYGANVLVELNSKGITHPTQEQIGAILSLISRDDDECSTLGNYMKGISKVSKGLANDYLGFIVSTTDYQPGQGVGLTRGAIIAGTLDNNEKYKSDFVVSISDEKEIAKNIFGSLDDHYFEYALVHSDPGLGIPLGLTNGLISKTKIKKVLNG